MVSTPHIPTLNIDLDAIAANWQWLNGRFTGSECAGVVKANGYGLGANQVAAALADAGCKTFFVATLEEGIALRKTLTQEPVFLFQGVGKGEENELAAHRLSPVLNTPEQMQTWASLGKALPAALHIDTGMSRLGLTMKEARAVAEDEALLQRCGVGLVMSHLACANEPSDPKNKDQLMRMYEVVKLFPGKKTSLCNSSGILLPEEFHFDLARPGCALYGITPVGKNEPNPMRPVVTFTAPILQIRQIDRVESVGYGATHTAPEGAVLATVALGYADGYSRHLSNRGQAYIGDHKVAVVGRVSMDMITLDVTHVPPELLREGAQVEIIGPHQGVDQVAEQAGTIGYEIFTRLGERIKRIYQGGPIA